jgi:RNA polymerase sigma-70 factor (ECF subfamily)
MTDTSDELEGLNSLDPKAITAIHDRYYSDIYRFARFRVNDEMIAEDIAGDVFMHLLEAVHKNNGPTRNLRGWLLRVTANVVNDHFRKMYNRPKEDSSEIHENSHDLYISQDSPDVIVDKAERSRLIQLALEKLTDAQKLVITLRFGNRFSLEETSKIMGKNSNTIKALQFRALISLRKNIGDDLL